MWPRSFKEGTLKQSSLDTFTASAKYYHDIQMFSGHAHIYQSSELHDPDNLPTRLSLL